MAVRWGFLSTARINRLLLEGARLSDRVEVVAVASRDAARARAYADEHGIERAHGSYDALLADPEVDAIYISLPNSLHVEWTLRALAAGKHVLVEKPFSRRAADVERVFDAAEQAGLVVSEAFMWRHHPQTKTLAELVTGGRIGRLRLVRAAFSFLLSRPGDVRLSADLDGGALMDVGCYCVSAARLLAGEPERVTGEQIVGESGVDTVFAGTFRLPGDVVAHFDCGLVLPERAELEVVGDEGALFLADPWHARDPGLELRRPGREPELIAVPRANSYQLQLENVSDAIRGEAPLLLGRDDAVGQARALEALYEAAA
jgi:D-xylose 1-dehydrogenase (NADP+, D-xylono-1,5-lactone-forming)